MRFLPPLVFHGAHKASEAELAGHAETYAQRLADYPAWPEIDLVEDCVECAVPPSARPTDRIMEAA